LDTANRNAIAGSNLSVVTSQPEKITRDFMFVNQCTVSDTSISFNANYNVTQVPVITRPKPGAFVIFPVTEKIKTVLTVSGISIKEITQPQQVNVQEYVMDEKGKISLADSNMVIPAGALVIDTHQRMSNVIADLMEPEGANSMYKNNIIRKQHKENLVPVYRITKEQLLQLQTN
jgi:hypothetical protein